MEKRNPNQARTLGVIEAKRLIVAASLAGTVGLWYLFTNQAGKDANSVTMPAPTVAASPVADNSTMAGLTINFPPLPTLVPTLADSVLPLQSQVIPTQPPPVAVQPEIQAPAKIIIAGAKAPSVASASSPGKSSAPAPAARTRSSK